MQRDCTALTTNLYIEPHQGHNMLHAVYLLWKKPELSAHTHPPTHPQTDTHTQTHTHFYITCVCMYIHLYIAECNTEGVCMTVHISLVLSLSLYTHMHTCTHLRSHTYLPTLSHGTHNSNVLVSQHKQSHRKLCLNAEKQREHHPPRATRRSAPKTKCLHQLPAQPVKHQPVNDVCKQSFAPHLL